MFRADEKDSNTPIQAILLPASGPVPIQKGKPADLHQMIAADLKAYEQAGVSEKAANAHLRKAWKARGQDWTRAMELDWPEGVFFVARCMQLGFGVPKDETAAADLLHKAAVRGLAVAQDALGHCYARGIGVEKEPRRAARCFHEAAKQGHAGAQYELGVVFERGLGVAMNLKQAAIWYRKAAKQGHLQAEEAFVRVRDKK